MGSRAGEWRLGSSWTSKAGKGGGARIREEVWEDESVLCCMRRTVGDVEEAAEAGPKQPREPPKRFDSV
ncbi:hypothetical protein PS1_007137 [Malus domestica]